jgi:hypothetical protein
MDSSVAKIIFPTHFHEPIRINYSAIVRKFIVTYLEFLNIGRVSPTLYMKCPFYCCYCGLFCVIHSMTVWSGLYHRRWSVSEASLNFSSGSALWDSRITLNPTRHCCVLLKQW